MEAAEALTRSILPEQVYPQDFIIFRITRYRPDTAPPGGEEVGGLVGAALVGDLATLIQRLSESLELPAGEGGRTPLRIEEVAERLEVSTKTVQRYRRRGLVCHYVVFPDGAKRLCCYADALEHFVRVHRDRVDRARGFSRLTGDDVSRLVEEAAAVHREQGLSLNGTAQLLARRYGRAAETIRALLVRHDRRARQPVFGEHGALSHRDLQVVWRAARRGVGTDVIARRFGKTRPTIHRALNQARRARLVELGLPAGDDVDIDALQHSAVRSALPVIEPVLDVLALLDTVHGAPDADPELESVLAAAYRALVGRSGAAIAALPDYPTSEGLDAIETDLRWATLVKRKLISYGLPPALRSAEQFLGRSIAEQPSDEMRSMLRRVIDVVARCADAVDPQRGQRYSHVCGYAMTRALAAGDPPPAGRAARRHEPGSVILERPFERITAWHAWLGARCDPRRVGRPARRELLEARYGLTGARPRTLTELADRFGGTPGGMARAIAGAERGGSN